MLLDDRFTLGQVYLDDFSCGSFPGQNQKQDAEMPPMPRGVPVCFPHGLPCRSTHRHECNHARRPCFVNASDDVRNSPQQACTQEVANGLTALGRGPGHCSNLQFRLTRTRYPALVHASRTD